MTATAFSETQALEAPARRVDPRLAFLLSCAIRFELVERQEMTLDEAFDDIERLRVIAGITCSCEREILNAFERYTKPTRRCRSS
jgi:hypothetical protein